MQYKQKGMVLFMSMIMLLLLTIMGVSSIQTTSLQQRMARNASDVNLAFQAAESGLRDAEGYIEDLTSMALVTSETVPFYDEAAPGVTPNWLTLDWDSAADCRTAETVVTGVAEQPKYIIEHLKTVISDADNLNLDNIGQGTGSGRNQVFRITSRGVGGSGTAVVILQETYGRQL